MGGYDITYAQKDTLLDYYPEVNVFICGNAEALLRKIMQMPNDYSRKQTVLQADKNFDLTSVPAIYAGGYLQPSRTNRLESLRGCPYTCTFCAHRDNEHNKVYHSTVERSLTEVAYLEANGSRKINFLDPVYNMKPSHYLTLTQEMAQMKVKSELSFQIRPELLTRDDGVNFLQTCTELDVTLEFGLQTIHEAEDEIIERKNDISKVCKAIRLTKDFNIRFEVSLIYGLPGQTLDSFRRTIEFCQEQGCENIVAFPLKLYKGTKLYEKKEQYGIKEMITGQYDLPYVVATHTFTENDWYAMRQLATELSRSSTKTII
jgi:radical SAM superfamily enzyme YgiQ (UPF0313 family)